MTKPVVAALGVALGAATLLACGGGDDPSAGSAGPAGAAGTAGSAGVAQGGSSGAGKGGSAGSTGASGSAGAAGAAGSAQPPELGRGINLGNALEAPNEGDWGVTLQAEYFPLIKNAGFATVRIPIRWSTHAAQSAPYTIDPDFLARVDWAVQQAKSAGLNAIINVHHYEEMMTDPVSHKGRLEALWQQIASRFQNEPPSLLFELLNEPNLSLDDATWNALIPELVKTIRQSNPTRMIVVGGVDWNGISGLGKLDLPDSDPNLMVTFHYYSPFPFTHQGAEWVSGSEAWLGTAWEATQAEKDAVDSDFDTAAAWASTHGRKLLLGEFGAYSKADMDSRARWTDYVARAAELRGFAWTYWEFCSGFGAYDPAQQLWRDPLLDALIPAD